MFSDTLTLHDTACFNSVCVGNGIDNGLFTFFTWSFHIACTFWKSRVLFFTSREWNFFLLCDFLSRHNWSFLSTHFNHFFNWLFSDTLTLHDTACFNSVCVGNGIDNGLFTFFTWSFHIACTFWKSRVLFFTFCEWNFFLFCHFLSCDHRSLLGADFDDLINRLFSDRFALLLAFCFDTIGQRNRIDNSLFTIFPWSFHVTCTFWKVRIGYSLFSIRDWFCNCDFLSGHNSSLLGSDFNHFFNWLLSNGFALLLAFRFFTVDISNGIDNGLFSFLTRSLHVARAFWKICILFLSAGEWNLFRLCHFFRRFSWSWRSWCFT